MHLTTTVLFVGLAFATFVDLAQQQEQMKRGEYQDNRYGYFKAFLSHSLNVSVALAIVSVQGYMDCAFACLGNVACFSFNFAIEPDINFKQHACHLLATDKYRNPDRFVWSQEFNHYAIPSPCESIPCQGGTCHPLYNENDYLYDCRDGTSAKTCCETVSVYKNCAEIYQCGCNVSQVYKIDPDGLGQFEVFCDQKTAGGGWTVFQKRYDGSVDFYREWADYKRGFGNLTGEFWLGLDKIHRLTVSSSNKLRVDLEDVQGNTAYAEYSSFAVANEKEKYNLSVGGYSGTADDSLAYHHGFSFTTKDRDNDGWPDNNCAFTYKGAWWYNSCHKSNLNGRYNPGVITDNGIEMIWFHWKNGHYSARRSEMKIRPNNF